MDVLAFHCSCLSGVSIGIQTLHRKNTQVIKPNIMFFLFFIDMFFRAVPCSKWGVGPRSFRADHL